MSKINYQALREAAEKALHGEWGYEAGAIWNTCDSGYVQHMAAVEAGDEVSDEEHMSNMRFITLATPTVVLGLLDELSEAKAAEENESSCANSVIDIAINWQMRAKDAEAKLEAAEKRIAELEAEPVSQTYNLPELIEGMEVSIDVSTCDADLGNRYFGTVTEALELDTAKNGYILLVQDAEPNFDVNGNSPVTPDGWVVVPKRLTAENGAKGALSGEFSETTFISCQECFGDDDCDTCDGSGRIEIKVPVTWSTIKSIWDKGIEYFAAKPSQEVK